MSARAAMRWFSTQSYRAGPYTGIADLEVVGMRPYRE